MCPIKYIEVQHWLLLIFLQSLLGGAVRLHVGPTRRVKSTSIEQEYLLSMHHLMCML
jgi:hypothetical protein